MQRNLLTDILFSIAFFTTVSILSSGCKNTCQSLCADIEDFAKDCGYEFEASDYRECISGNRWISFSAKKECRSAIPKLEDEWTCDDIAVYFDDESLFNE